MRLGQEFLALEPRDELSAYIGSGVFRFPDGFELKPFEDWTGELSVQDTPDGETWVGAGAGGGPRVGVFDTASHQRNRPDYFAGDPNSRTGIVIVVPRPAVRGETSVGDKKDYPVFLDFEGPTALSFQSAIVRGVAAKFMGLPLYFTNVRPAMPPGDYATCVVGAPTVWDGWNTAGYAPTQNFGAKNNRPDPWDAATVYAGAWADAALTVSVAAHEIGHGFGLPHKAGTIMNPSAMLGGEFDQEELALMGVRVS